MKIAKNFKITDLDLSKASEDHSFCLTSLKLAMTEIERLRHERDGLKNELDYVEERLRIASGEPKNHPWRG